MRASRVTLAPSTQETELKLRLRPQDVPQLRRRLDRLGSVQLRSIDNTYFDTADLRLAASKAALRLRRIEHAGRQRWVQTLKTEPVAAALSVRGEWETPVRAAAIEPERLAHSPLAQLLRRPKGAHSLAARRVQEIARLPAASRARESTRLPAARRLQPVFQTVFERSSWEVQAYGARIEAAIDEGQIRAGARTEPVLELELELIDGSPLALLKLALQLAGVRGGRPADLGLLPYGDSKAARGYRLARSLPPLALETDLAAVLAAGLARGAPTADALGDWEMLCGGLRRRLGEPALAEFALRVLLASASEPRRDGRDVNLKRPTETLTVAAEARGHRRA
jgi:inorganic triphosphatase YgiF